MSSDLASATGVACRYATALFELALDAAALEPVEADINALRGVIAESEDFGDFLKSPIYDEDTQFQAVAAIGEKGGVHELTLNFLKLLAKNRRLFALEDIIKTFSALAASHRGEITAEAVAAVPLNDEQVKALRMEIEATAGKAVNLETRVDPDLLGGLVVKIGSKMIDSSLRTKLNRLKTVMKEA